MTDNKPRFWLRIGAGAFVGLAGALVVAGFGGPRWAIAMTCWLTYQIIVK